MQHSHYHDYDVAKVLIAVWLPFITFVCICVAHALMWFKGTREHLGKLVKKYVPKTNSSERSTSREVTEDKQRFFFFNQRVIFPMMLLVVIGATVGDIYLYAKYRHHFSNKEDSLFIFPMPVIAPVFMVVNSIMTIITFLIFKHQKIFEHISDYILTTGTLLLLFGITYLFYHGFWLIIALLAYPGRILIGGTFVVPAFVVIIPIWNMFIYFISNWYEAFKLACKREQQPEQRKLLQSEECKPSQSEESMPSQSEESNPSQSEESNPSQSEESKPSQSEESKPVQSKKRKALELFFIGCGWLVLLIIDIAFWGLFLAIIYYISRFLLSTISLQDENLKSALSYIAITAVSGVLLWINTDLVIYQKDNDSNQETQENNTSVPPTRRRE